MPQAVAPPLAMKPDNIVLTMHHGNQVNKSLWHYSSSLQALQKAIAPAWPLVTQDFRNLSQQ